MFYLCVDIDLTIFYEVTRDHNGNFYMSRMSYVVYKRLEIFQITTTCRLTCCLSKLLAVCQNNLLFVKITCCLSKLLAVCLVTYCLLPLRATVFNRSYFKNIEKKECCKFFKILKKKFVIMFLRSKYCKYVYQIITAIMIIIIIRHEIVNQRRCLMSQRS